MLKANNLSDLTNKTEARKNLDVYAKSEVDTKIRNATPNIDLSGYARKEHTHTIGQITNLQSSLDGKAPKTHTHTTAEITDLQAKLDAKIDKSEKGQPNGVATLNANGAIDSMQIPPYLENPLVYINRSKFPTTGRLGKLYMDEETGNLYVWNQNQYKEYTDHIGVTVDTSDKANLAGGNTFSGDQILNNALNFGDYAPEANQSTKARVGRATDRGEGSVTFQLGKGDISKQNFQIVDGNWTKVLFEVADNGKVMIPDWLLVGGQVFANRKTP